MTTIERNDQILAMLIERANLLDQRERSLTAELNMVSEDLRRARAAIAALDPKGSGTKPVAIPPAKHGAANDVPFAATIEAILREAGNPMHMREIMTHIQKRGMCPDWDYKRFRDSLNGTVGRKARAKKVFFAAGDGVYGLLEWKQRRSKESRASEAEAAKGPTMPNTEIVMQFVGHHPGMSRADLIKAVEGRIQTASTNPHKIASTTISNLITQGRLVDDKERGIRIASHQQLSLVTPGDGAAA